MALPSQRDQITENDQPRLGRSEHLEEFSVIASWRSERSMGLALLPLGTGKGATSVYDGDPSSAFCVTLEGECQFLVDIGLGVVRQCRRHFEELPRLVYVSHNHTDHAGELPVALIVEHSKGRNMTVVAAPDVIERLTSHRIHELASTGKNPHEIANWIRSPPGESTRLNERLSLVTHRGRHSEVSYGFVLYLDGRPVLAYSGDSGHDEQFYRKLAVAPTMVLDARRVGSPEHASFAEIKKVQSTLNDHRILVTGYGRSDEAPTSEETHALVPGKPLQIA